MAARNYLWEALRFIVQDIHSPWLVIGDFNAVLYSHERSSGSLGVGNKDKAFRDFVQDVALIDLGFSGLCFTWSKGNSTDTFFGARIDRAICNSD